MATTLTATKWFEDKAFEWEAHDASGYRMGVLILDNEGTWYAQDLKANFERFETGTDGERMRAAIEWLEAR